MRIIKRTQDHVSCGPYETIYKEIMCDLFNIDPNSFIQINNNGEFLIYEDESRIFSRYDQRISFMDVYSKLRLHLHDNDITFVETGPEVLIYNNDIEENSNLIGIVECNYHPIVTVMIKSINGNGNWEEAYNKDSKEIEYFERNALYRALNLAYEILYNRDILEERKVKEEEKEKAKQKAHEEYMKTYISPKPIEYIPTEDKSKIRSIDVWLEGYSATGQSSEAQFVCRIDEANLSQAVLRYYGEQGKLDSLSRCNSGCGYEDWGRRFFDNEADARKSFG